MAGKGGAIPGNGRKSRAEEVKSGEIAREALTKKYGGLRESLERGQKEIKTNCV